MSPCGRRGGVGVDVHDVLRLDLRLGEGAQDRARSAATGRVRLGDVVGIGGDAGTEHLGIDLRAAGLGVFLGLEDQDAGTLAQHEAVAAGVPGPGDGRRVAGVLGERHHVRERRHRQRVDGGLGAAGEHDVGSAEADLVQGEGDALVAGRTGRDGRVGGAPGTEEQAHVGCGCVGHQHRHRERGHAARALVTQEVVVVEEGGHAADAGGDGDAEAVLVDVGVLEAGVLPSLHGRHDGELGGPVEASGLDPLDDLGRFDGHPGRDLDRHLLGPVLGQVTHAGLALDHRLPGGRDVPAQGGGGAEAGDDDSLRRHGESFGTRWCWLLVDKL